LPRTNCPVIASFAPLANLLVLAFPPADGGQCVALVQVALDFRSTTELRRRPLAALLPLPLHGPVTLDGILVDESASRGVLSATHEGAALPHVLVDFDPGTLSLREQAHFVSRLALPFAPLHFLGQSDVVGVSTRPGDDGLFHIYKFSADRATVCVPLRLNPYNEGFRCKIGVVEASRQPVLVTSTEQGEPVLLSGIAELPAFPALDDMFAATFDCETIPQFAAGVLARFGLSEVERIALPTRACHPVELAKIDVLTRGAYKSGGVAGLVRGLRAAMPASLPRDWAVPLAVHHFEPPAGRPGLAAGVRFPVSMSDPTLRMISLLTRLNCLPRALVARVPPPRSLARLADAAERAADHALEHAVAAAAARAMTRCPPFPLLRATVPRSAAVLALVDIGDADGTAVFSALTGVPFTTAPTGSFRMGINYLLDFGENPNWRRPDGRGIAPAAVAAWRNVLALSIRAERAHLPVTNVVALYTALGASDLVVVRADDAQFLLAVLETLIGAIGELERSYGHLFFPELRVQEGELPEECEAPPRIAFVTDLGAAPRIRMRELEGAIAACLEGREGFVRSIFQSSTVLFVDANASTFEIARTIAQRHFAPLVDKEWAGFRRRTDAAMASVQNAAGYFAGLLSYVDDCMLTGEEKVAW
jgi:hypothetical protein